MGLGRKGERSHQGSLDRGAHPLPPVQGVRVTSPGPPQPFTFSPFHKLGSHFGPIPIPIPVHACVPAGKKRARDQGPLTPYGGPQGSASAPLSCDDPAQKKLEPSRKVRSSKKKKKKKIARAAGARGLARGGLAGQVRCRAGRRDAGGAALTHRPRVGLGSAPAAAGAGCPERGALLYSALMDGVSWSGRGQGWGALSATLPYLVAFTTLRSAEAIHGAKGRGEDQPRGPPDHVRKGRGQPGGWPNRELGRGRR